MRRQPSCDPVEPLTLSLARSVHFASLGAALIEALAATGRRRKYADGALVHARSTRGSPFVLVLSGSLRIVYPEESGDAVTLAILQEGSFHNVNVALGAADTVTEAYAFGVTEVAAFARHDLGRLLEEHPALDRHFKRLAVARMSAAISLSSDATAAPLERRLARRLVAQSTSRSDAGREAHLRGTQSMFADMLRVGRTALSEKLGQWQRRRLLRVAYRTLVVLDMPRLRRLAGQRVPAL